jgi:hypothetical protein
MSEHEITPEMMDDASTRALFGDTETGKSELAGSSCSGGCPQDCGHSEIEHNAFDVGVDDGEKGSDEAIPAHYESGAARAAYMLGLSVGGLTRRNRQNAKLSRDGQH